MRVADFAFGASCGFSAYEGSYPPAPALIGSSR